MLPRLHFSLQKMSEILQTLHLNECEVNRYKNIYAVQELIPKVFLTFLQWGTKDKPENITYYEYITIHKGITTRQLKKKYRFIHRNIEIIKTEKNFHNFDATLLFSLIQVCCSGIKDPDDPVWEEDNEQKMEGLLKSLKDQRNSVVHGTLSTKADAFDSITKRLEDLIQISGKCYLPDNSVEVSSQVQELNRKISEISSIGVRNEFFVREQEFLYKARAEGKKYWCESSFGRLLRQDRKASMFTKCYFPLNLVITYHSTSQCACGRTISSKKLLEGWITNDDARITVVEGESGAGKTTLASKIVHKFYSSLENEEGLCEKYQLLHYLQCRDRNQRTLLEFLQLQYPSTCNKYDMEDAERCFYHSSNLIVVDGYDEINDGSADTFNEILKSFERTTSGHIIVTTRPYETKFLTMLLQSKGLSYRVAKLKEIDTLELKIQFLRKWKKYKETIHCVNSASHEIVTKFLSLNESSMKFFNTPFTLVAFASSCSIHALNHNKLVSFDVINLIHEENIRVLYTKVSGKDISNVELMIDDIVNELGKFAFYCVKKNILTVIDADLEELSSSLKQILEHYACIHLVDTKQVLFTFLRYTLPPYPNSKHSYKFHHKSVMELMAAKTIVPVLGVPVNSKYLKGMDSLLSIVQMPKGIPVATYAIGEAGAANAALSAVSILAVTDSSLADKLAEFREKQQQSVFAMTLPPESE